MKSTIFAIVAAILVTNLDSASATPFTGDAIFIDPTNQAVGTIPITGDLNIVTSNMSVDPFVFLGSQWSTKTVELLGSGTHTPRRLR